MEMRSARYQTVEYFKSLGGGLRTLKNGRQTTPVMNRIQNAELLKMSVETAPGQRTLQVIPS